MRDPLTDDYIAEAKTRAYQRGIGTWTGTTGAIAADVIRLCWEIERLKAELARRDETQVPTWLKSHD
jgi:hypothetical protein